jgi:coproporphyrinogen III oxidase-like Fe-S oxidoreductase
MARALYIHWPFCLAKCPYCDFNSHVRDGVEVEAWQQALLADMRHEAALAGGKPLTSVFFGGGTPSLMPPALVERLLKEAEQLWGFDPVIEITLEANPSSVEASKFAQLAQAGINRVSLGLQALDDETLRFLGRLHDANEGLAALDVAQRAFARVNFDLIYARPDQRAADWHAELARAIALGTSHLSLYQLTIEPGTRFETMVRQRNHARPGEESRHNLTYWRYQDYCGIGPGAHGRRLGMATVRHRKPENWLSAIARNGHGVAEERPLGTREKASEAMLMGLRLAEGVDLAELAARFGLNASELHDAPRCSRYQRQGLLWFEGSRVGVTPAGMPLLDALLAEIVPDDLVSA